MNLFKRKPRRQKVDREKLKLLRKELRRLDIEEEREKEEKTRPTDPPREYDEPDPPETSEKNPKKKSGQEQEIMGKYMLKEMPLFKYEIVLYLVMVMVAGMLYILDTRGVLPGILSRIVIPMAVLPMAVWFVKWALYMPRKNKVPSLRIFRSGVMELGIEDIGKGYITYGRGENVQKKYITKLNKHTEASTGKPFLVTSELRGENISLLEDTEPDMQSKEFNALLETNTAVTTKNVMNRMMKFAMPKLDNPMVLLLLANLIISAVLLVKELGLLQMIQGG